MDIGDVCRGWSLNPLTFNSLIPLFWFGLIVECLRLGSGLRTNSELGTKTLELDSALITLLQVTMDSSHYGNDENKDDDYTCDRDTKNGSSSCVCVCVGGGGHTCL